MPSNVLAQVGDRYITVDEFVTRAELSPLPNFRSVNGFTDKRGLLELLIGEKLLANEAEALGLRRDPAFQTWQRYTERVAVVKELYRDEILSKVEIREGEIDTAIALVQKSLPESKPLLTQSEYLQRRASIKKILRTRRADELSDRFVQRFMSNRNLVLKGKAFSQLAKYIEQRVEFKYLSPVLKMQPLTEVDYRRLEDDLHSRLDEPLIVFAGGQWSIRETLEKLRLKELPLNRESPTAMRNTLRRDLLELARDELLAQEGYRRHLDKRPAVQEEVRVWVDHHLYTQMISRLSLPPQFGAEIEFPPQIAKLKDKYRVTVAEDKLKQTTLTGINMFAFYPGRPQRLAVPLWPRF
ncbi:MAG: hypothetical protein ONB44_17775 [candidate division KSB1 bacterium]|nr:hypothetical protein [candidate division KSB1 bacterium]MDZ7303976.1 hypothetical protein [candidate division KSB1 bacterium]MDZ7313678.1 hypothetical protein [candidate division KSB1 bacterium]